MGERRIYPNPPIVEAVCEIRFAQQDAGPDPTIPGKVHGKLAELYGGQSTTQIVGVQKQGAERPGEVAFEQESRARLVSADGCKVATIGHTSLSVSSLRPYEGWKQSFRERIRLTFDTYREVAKPTAITRIGIRYINRIEIPEDDFTLEQYFKIVTPAPSDRKKSTVKLFSRATYRYEDEVGLTISLGTADDGFPNKALLLDIDTFAVYQDDQCPIEEVHSKIEDLRDRERDAFEAAITEKTRQLFGEKE